MLHNSHRITIAVIIAAAIFSAAIFSAAPSCKRGLDNEQDPDPELVPYEVVEINNIVIKSEYITDKDFRCPFNVILPSDFMSSGKKYPVLYLFHGIIDDNNIWQEKGNVVGLTENAVNSGVIVPFIIVLPNAYMTFYVDDLDWSNIPIMNRYPKLKFESFFTKELQPYIEKNFPVMTDREHTAVAGISMGGYGASYHAFNYPWKYSYCASFSGAVSGGNWTLLTDKVPSVEDIFRNKGYDETSFSSLPEYVMDCGADDILCAGFNKETDAFLNEVKFPHVYRSFPGGHIWKYWSGAYQRMLPELAVHFNK